MKTPAEKLREELKLLKKWENEGQDVKALIRGTAFFLELALEEERKEKKGGDNDNE